MWVRGAGLCLPTWGVRGGGDRFMSIKGRQFLVNGTSSRPTVAATKGGQTGYTH